MLKITLIITRLLSELPYTLLCMMSETPDDRCTGTLPHGNVRVPIQRGMVGTLT